MESALRPRDIQARIRAGASPEEVAQAAGVPVQRIDAFAAPVIAEREYIAGLSRANPVRRRGETASHRTLRNAVADSLAARGVDADAAEWDAWKLEDRRWQVRVAFEVGGERQEGLFVFDPMGRFTVAANEEARALIGDTTFDELALVRATQDAVEAEVEEPEEPRAADDGFDADDAFHEVDLAEVDGVYDIVPPDRHDLDVLYDMLSSFDEDSVKIYAGLVHPKESTPEPRTPVVVGAEGSEVPAPTEEDEAAAPVVDDGEPEPQAPVADEPEQLSLIDEVEEPAPRPKPRTRRKRAAVPSWDEIMFGAPHTPKSDD